MNKTLLNINNKRICENYSYDDATNFHLVTKLNTMIQRENKVFLYLYVVSNLTFELRNSTS